METNLTTLIEEQKKEFDAQFTNKGTIWNRGKIELTLDPIQNFLTTATTKGYELALAEVEKLRKTYWNGHGDAIIFIDPEDLAHLKEPLSAISEKV